MAGTRRVLLHRLHPVLSRAKGRRLGLPAAWVALFLVTLLCSLAVPGLAHRPGESTPAVLATSTPDLFQSSVPIDLEEQARQLYEAGNYSEAVQVLQRGLQSYRQKQDAIGMVVVLNNLCLSYQRLGQWEAAQTSLKEALTLLKQAADSPDRASLTAQTLDVQGSLQLARGQTAQAIDSWSEAAARYRQAGNLNRLALSQINQAQALQALGLYRRAISTLQATSNSLSSHPDSLIKAATLRNLGDGLRTTGALEDAHQVLQQALTIARAHQATGEIAAIQLSLGNLLRVSGDRSLARDQRSQAQANFKAALEQYQQVAEASVAPLLRAQALLNQLQLLTETPPKFFLGREQGNLARSLYGKIQPLIASLPGGRAAIEIQLGLGQSLLKLTGSSTSQPSFVEQAEIARIFARAVAQARRLQDPRTLSYAIGDLAVVYEQAGQWAEAQQLTQEALGLAQAIDATDITYRWQGQLGRILKAQVSKAELDRSSQDNPTYTRAIANYTQAFNTLQSLRRDLVATNTDLQFSFRESVEPVYRQLVDLLLLPETPSQTNLRQARQVLESLQLAELENFLQSACQDNTLQVDRVIDQEDKTAAVIYPILLENRLEVILKLPQQQDLYHYRQANLGQRQVEKTLRQFQVDLQKEYSFDAVREDGQQIYDWLIRPIAEQLEARRIRTLIFVLDGALRSIPMAALHDGQQYLVEKYATALLLGLEVRDPEPLKRQHMKVLGASLTNPPPQFKAEFDRLPNVDPELNQIQNAGVPARFIRNEEFTKARFSQTLSQNQFQIVHLATHGQFGASRESTFLLAADDAIYVDQLSQVFQTKSRSRADAIELLILSACKTATGNDRAVLGIAGTTVRSGARSAIAGLWSLADAPSVIFTQELYQHLGQPGTSRAEALRQAQIALLRAEDDNYAHPRFWAPYVLVGSWL